MTLKFSNSFHEGIKKRLPARDDSCAGKKTEEKDVIQNVIKIIS